MPISFTTTAPDRESEIREFLTSVFGLTEIPPNLLSSTLAWKYFAPHPWWPDVRSYILLAPEGITAHGCVTPVRFAIAGNTVESMQIIDWAAGRTVPAAGLLIYRRCLEASRGTLLAIGGSEDTRRIIPQVKWFNRKDDVRYYVRPLRPWRHYEHTAKNPRDLARLARNLYWGWIPRPTHGDSWSCRPARPGEDVFSHNGDFIPIVRTRAWFDYLLRCPAVRMELVILERAGIPRGHALLANALGSVRIADFVVGGRALRPERVAAFSALARYIAVQPDAAEIVAASSLPEIYSVFEDCGMRGREASPVYLADPLKLIPPNARIEITPLIGDAFYLYNPAYPFAC